MWFPRFANEIKCKVPKGEPTKNIECQINATKMVMNLPAFSSRDLDFDSPNGGFSGPKKVRKMGPNEEVTTSSEPGDLVVLSNFCKK